MSRDRRAMGWLEGFAHKATHWAGSSWAFGLAVGTILLWGITGPMFGYSDTWQLAINTSTTVVTFLMVFLIQRAQNNDSRAVHLKLNELVAAMHGASNRLLNVEQLNEHEVDILCRHYDRLTQLAKQDKTLTESHSIEEATVRHRRKRDPAPV